MATPSPRRPPSTEDRQARRPIFWPWALLAVFAVLLVGGLGLQYAAKDPVVLESLPRGERLAVYTATAGASGALLGFVIAAVAVLVALPSTDATSQLKELQTWRELPRVLLVTAAALGLTLVTSITGLSADASKPPSSAFEAVAFASMITSVLGLIVGFAAFGLALTYVHDRPSGD